MKSNAIKLVINEKWDWVPAELMVFVPQRELIRHLIATFFLSPGYLIDSYVGNPIIRAFKLNSTGIDYR